MMDRYSKKIEEKWVNHWYSNNIYAFKDSGDKPIFSIDTPPPFTSGKMHMGHVLSYSLFDFAARYKRMRGFNVLYPQGWDCQGFPTEVKVEKKYGRNLTREEFIQRCIQWTKEFIATMRTQMMRMGFSADWSREYRTMDEEYHKKVQYSLINMYKQGLIYMGTHPVFWCTDCRSAIAKAETEEIERETVLNYIRFKVAETNEDLIIATTRPEYLHACVAVFVHPDDERYKHLIGKTAVTPLGKKVKIMSDVDVEKDFGTGIVMVCTFGDKQDAVWVYRHNLPIIDAIDETGRLRNSSEFDGMKIKEARKAVLDKIKKDGNLIKTEELKQVVKIHDRCNKPIELKLSKQWFCKIDGFQRDIIKAAREMEWIPNYTLQYLVDWTNFVEWDWVISRQRYFGTPLPFYVCSECGQTKAVDIDELPFKPENAKQVKCDKCGKMMYPESSVADVWVDSSITPLIICGWPDNKNWKNYYPVTLRPQGIEIIRTWAFYTIYRTMMLTGKPPFKQLLLNGNVLGPDGKKMSKSLGNVIDPLELVEKYSADAVRIWVAMSGAATRDRPFNYQEMKYAQSFINKLWNASRFVENACKDYNGNESENIKLYPSDRWIIDRLERVKGKVTQAYEKYDYFTAMSELHNFFWHSFCDNYLEFVKYRIYGEDEGVKASAQHILREVLEQSLKMLAPIIVFTTEHIYHELFSKNSIHLADWPEQHSEYIRDEYKDAGDLLVSIIGEVRKHKSGKKLSLKEELPFLKIYVTKDLEKYCERIRDEVKNIGKIKEIEFVIGEQISVVE